MSENNPINNIFKVFENLNGSGEPKGNNSLEEKAENPQGHLEVEEQKTVEKEGNKTTDEETKKRGRPKKTDTETATTNTTQSSNQPSETSATQTTEEINPFKELISYIKTKNNWQDLEFETVNDIDDFTDTLNSYLQKNRKPDIKDPLLDILMDYTTKGGSVYDFITNLNKDDIKLNYKFENENDKIKFLYDYCKDTTNWSEEKIKSYLEKTYKSDMLEEELNEAINYYNQIKVDKIKKIIDEQNKYYEEMSKAYEEQFNRYIEVINNHSEEVIGEKLDKKTKDEFISFLFQKNEESGYTKYQDMIRSKPELELKIAFEYYKHYLNTDNEKIRKNRILNELKSQIHTGKSNTQTKGSSGDIRQTLDNLFKK